MKLNKPYAYLYTHNAQTHGQILIVLVVSDFEQITAMSNPQPSGSDFEIELSGAEVSPWCKKFEFEVDGSIDREITTKTVAVDQHNTTIGFTKLQTAQAADAWNHNFFVGFHLEVDSLINPQYYTIHGLAMDIDSVFSLSYDGVSGNTQMIDAHLPGNIETGNCLNASMRYSNPGAGGFTADRIRIITKTNPSGNGEYIKLEHLGADDKYNPFGKTSK